MGRLIDEVKSVKCVVAEEEVGEDRKETVVKLIRKQSHLFVPSVLQCL
jgi:hypothetical protein